MNEQWEYWSIYVHWTHVREGQQRYEDWVAEVGEELLVGMTVILNYFGRQGWELVNLIPESAKGKLTAWASAEVLGYRVIFKRRVAVELPTPD